MALYRLEPAAVLAEPTLTEAGLAVTVKGLAGAGLPLLPRCQSWYNLKATAPARTSLSQTPVLVTRPAPPRPSVQGRRRLTEVSIRPKPVQPSQNKARAGPAAVRT